MNCPFDWPRGQVSIMLADGNRGWGMIWDWQEEEPEDDQQ